MTRAKLAERENAVIVAIGITGSGKTYLLRRLADRARRLIVADPEGKYPLGPGDERVTTGRALLEALRTRGAVDPAVPFRLVYQADDPDVMVRASCGAALALRNVTLFWDEIVWICSARRFPKPLERLFQVGREARVNLLLTTREPTEIPDFCLSQSSVRYLFHMDPGRGRERVARYYRIPEAELEGLARGEFRIFGDEEPNGWIGQEGLDKPPPRTVLSPSKRQSRRR